MRHSMAIKLEIGPKGRSHEVDTIVSYLCDMDSEPENPQIHIIEVALDAPTGTVKAPWLATFLADDGTAAELVRNAREARLAA